MFGASAESIPDRLLGTSRYAARLHVAADELDDGIHRRARLKHRGHAALFQGFHILVGNDAAYQHQHVVHLVLFQQVHHARHDGVVRAGENAEPDHVHVLLQRGVDDHLGGLAKAGVDHFHAGVAQGAGDDFRAAVVAIEARLGNKYADFAVRGHSALFAFRSSLCHREREPWSGSRNLLSAPWFSAEQRMIDPRVEVRKWRSPRIITAALGCAASLRGSPRQLSRCDPAAARGIQRRFAELRATAGDLPKYAANAQFLRLNARCPPPVAQSSHRVSQYAPSTQECCRTNALVRSKTLPRW